MYANIALLLEN